MIQVDDEMSDVVLIISKYTKKQLIGIIKCLINLELEMWMRLYIFPIDCHIRAELPILVARVHFMNSSICHDIYIMSTQ